MERSGLRVTLTRHIRVALTGKPPGPGPAGAAEGVAGLEAIKREGVLWEGGPGGGYLGMGRPWAFAVASEMGTGDGG